MHAYILDATAIDRIVSHLLPQSRRRTLFRSGIQEQPGAQRVHSGNWRPL